ALDGRVVGDDEDLAAGDAADPRDDARAGGLVVVHVERGQRGKLEERRFVVQQEIDTLADGQLALLAMPLEILRPAALAGRGHAIAELLDKQLHPLAIEDERLVSGVYPRVESYHPQQSDLYPHFEQRQTACMR